MNGATCLNTSHTLRTFILLLLGVWIKLSSMQGQLALASYLRKGVHIIVPRCNIRESSQESLHVWTVENIIWNFGPLSSFDEEICHDLQTAKSCQTAENLPYQLRNDSLRYCYSCRIQLSYQTEGSEGRKPSMKPPTWEPLVTSQLD